MNYAEQLRDHYFETKELVEEHRKKLMLCSVLTLEHKLRDGYDAYKEFCRFTGVQPKSFVGFLKTKVI